MPTVVLGPSAVTPLSEQVPADREHARGLRACLRAWLASAVDDPDVVEDVLLACSEAVENVVDHAFADGPVGTVTLHARVEAVPRPEVVVVVSDDGHWRPPSDPGHRGRGLSLIARLCSSHELDAGAGGTRVTMCRRL